MEKKAKWLTQSGIHSILQTNNQPGGTMELVIIYSLASFVIGMIFGQQQEAKVTKQEDYPLCKDCLRADHDDRIKNGSYAAYQRGTTKKCIRHDCSACLQEQHRADLLGVRGKNRNLIGCHHHNEADQWIPALRIVPRRQ